MIALISVYDKTGVVELARALRGLGADLVSTGGTHLALTEAGLPVRQVSELTSFPELLDGRVKTLHPAIHGGILARRDRQTHTEELAQHGIGHIDVVVGNLYPFEATISRPGITLEEALENIDIGGPTLLRAAAKNHPWVTVLVDPADYGRVVERLAGEGLTAQERRTLAAKAFQHVALYDTMVACWLRGGDGAFPEELTLGLRKTADLRYGENPHQQGALYADVPAGGGIVGATQLHGKELSYNNILDAEAAWRTVSDFTEATVAVVKHTNPCGLASHDDQAEAYRRAFAGDPVSAFGGIVAFNRPLSTEAAKAMAKVFFEIVLAPDFEEEALAVLRKKRDLRILKLVEAGTHTGPALEVRPVAGGALVQTTTSPEEDPASWRTATTRSAEPEELQDLAFAWRAVRHVKSNAIVLARGRAVVGMGAGQPNRVTSVHLALRAAGEGAAGCVLASDAFFPFPDGVELAARGGVTAIAQPGGSIRDEEVTAAAEAAGLAMLFTGVRHFRH